MMSGRASCSAEWMAKAAVFTLPSPSTTSPCELTRMRSDTRMWLNAMPNGFTQKWSRRSGSRAVMCPATPSSKPNCQKIRKPAARRCLRCCRSSSAVSNFGRYQRSSRTAVWAMEITSGCGMFSLEGRSRAERSGTEPGEPHELHHVAVVGHEEAGRPGTLDERAPVADAGDERRLGQHFGPPRFARHHRDRRHARVGRLAGPGIDEVVERARATGPAATQAGAGGDRTLPESELSHGCGAERIVDVDHPAVGRRRVAAGAEVAPQVHQHTGDPGSAGVE